MPATRIGPLPHRQLDNPEVQQNFEFLENVELFSERAVAMAYRSAALKIPSAVATRIQLDKVIQDPGANMNVAAGNGWYTVPADGYYHVDGSAAWATTNAEHYFEVKVAVNGTDVLLGTKEITVKIAGASYGGTVSGIIFCKAGDKIELRVYQDTGEEVALSVLEDRNRLSVMRVGEGPEGAKGLTGPQGIAGEKGTTGIEGPKGEKGEKGEIGPAGPGMPAGGAANEVIVWKAAGEGQWKKIVNANVEAAAGIEESKLSLPEVIKKTGLQTITNKKIIEVVGTENALQLKITKPVETSTSGGTSTQTPLVFTLATAGDTSITTTGTGGSGGQIEFRGTTGGIAGLAVTSSTGGKGSPMIFVAGEGGKAAVTAGLKNTGGEGGKGEVRGGAGGNATEGAVGVKNTGGASGAVVMVAQAGGKAKGAVENAVNKGGAGGEALVEAGAGGEAESEIAVGSKNTAGEGGRVRVKAGAAGFAGAPIGTAAKGGPVQLIAGAAAEAVNAGPVEVLTGTGAGTLRLKITGEGLVGIGNNATPAYALDVREGDIAVGTVGNGFRVKEGENAKMGVAKLATEKGKAIVKTTAVTANSRIFFCVNEGGLGNVGFMREEGRVVGKEFIIKSSNPLDESEVAWIIFEPA